MKINKVEFPDCLFKDLAKAMKEVDRIVDEINQHNDTYPIILDASKMNGVQLYSDFMRRYYDNNKHLVFVVEGSRSIDTFKLSFNIDGITYFANTDTALKIIGR